MGGNVAASRRYTHRRAYKWFMEDAERFDCFSASSPNSKPAGERGKADVVLLTPVPGGRSVAVTAFVYKPSCACSRNNTPSRGFPARGSKRRRRYASGLPAVAPVPGIAAAACWEITGLAARIALMYQGCSHTRIVAERHDVHA